jgi:outer membrane protein assembly factor BamB
LRYETLYAQIPLLCTQQLFFERSKEVKIKVNILFILMILLISMERAFAEDWPNWRGPNYDGISKETGWLASWPENGPKVLWEKAIGTGFASITVSKGKAYTMGNKEGKDYVYCFDAATGNEIWNKSYECPLYNNLHEGGPCSTPTVDGDAVYTLSKKGDIIRFNAATGDIVWQKNIQDEYGCKPPQWHFSSSPLIMGDLLILNAGVRGLALNKKDGSLKWQNGPGIGAYATAVPFDLDGKKRLAMLVEKEFIGLDVETGKVLWQIPWETYAQINATDIIISGNKLFVSTGYNTGCALYELKSDKPEEVYKNKEISTQLNSAVLWKGYLYGFDGNIGMNSPGKGNLKCMDFETGKVKWSQGDMGTGSLMLADGKLIILSEDGKLIIAEASPEGFRELASKQILTYQCWTVPVLANGRIYARNTAGKFVCVDVSSKN